MKWIAYSNFAVFCYPHSYLPSYTHIQICSQGGFLRFMYKYIHIHIYSINIHASKLQPHSMLILYTGMGYFVDFFTWKMVSIDIYLPIYSYTRTYTQFIHVNFDKIFEKKKIIHHCNYTFSLLSDNTNYAIVNVYCLM